MKKPLQIEGFSDFSPKNFYCRGINRDHEFGLRKPRALISARRFRLAIFLSRSAIKAAMAIGFWSAGICVNAPAL
jgi:hypothetical protein